MRTFLIELTEEDGDHPRRPSPKRWVDPSKVRDWVTTADEWGFDEIVLMADDCLVHPEIWDIVDDIRQRHMDVLLFSNGTFMSSEHARDFSMREVQAVVPVDFTDPVSGRVYGWKDVNNNIFSVLQRVEDTEVWQTITDNGQVIQNMLQTCMDNGLSWRGHLMQQKPDEQLMEMIQSVDQPVMSYDNWMFCHVEGEIPDIEFFQSELIRGRSEYTGSLHVDHNGILRSTVSDLEQPITFVSRDDLPQYALTQKTHDNDLRNPS